MTRHTKREVRMISVKEAAALAGVSPKTIRRMIRDGQILARRFRRTWRIPVTEITRMAPE